MNEEHRIETAAKVYLVFDQETDKWVVDPVTMDGASLDSGSLDDSECECERGPGHNVAIAAALHAAIPTGNELIRLLIDAALDRISPKISDFIKYCEDEDTSNVLTFREYLAVKNGLIKYGTE